MLMTALSHFHQDISRANDLRRHASTVSGGMLADDIRRAAWMVAVGASDAYFCDAYADIVSRALRAKDIEPTVTIPDRLSNLRIPVVAVIRQATGGWRWRMAARELMEDESVLSLDRIRQLFNHFFRKGHKIVNQDTIGAWLTHRDARIRCFGIAAAAYRGMNPAGQANARRVALTRFEERFAELFERRHDCIHNCDRPKVSVQRIHDGQVSKAIEDVDFLVHRVQEALLSEFPTYLQGLGFCGATRNQVLR